jgi:hypothetical protein
MGLRRPPRFRGRQAPGRAFAEDLRLLEDLGWAETVDRETVALTVPADQLTRTLARLHKDAAGSLGTGRTMNQAPAEKSGLKVFSR